MAMWMWTFLNFWIFIVKRIAARFDTLIIDLPGQMYLKTVSFIG